MAVNVGDKVTTTAVTDWNGTRLASFVRTNTYDVIQVNGNRVVIGKGSAVTAAVDLSTLNVVGGTQPQETPITPADTPTAEPAVIYRSEDRMSSSGIESALTALLNAGATNDIYRYSMRLFGAPHQFTRYCDHRSYSNNPDDIKTVGRKFIENIMLEAPVITFVPGKPIYLPAAANKEALSLTLLNSANETIKSATAAEAMSDDVTIHEKLRYYDFQQDYLSYMKYVNIMCASAASFLELDAETLDGVSLSNYDWKNYRWTASAYNTATGAALSASVNAVESFVNTLKTYGKEVLSTLSGNSGMSTNPYQDTGDDPDIVSELETILAQVNFVQFYADASTGTAEDASNVSGDSKLAGIFDSGNEFMREVAFMANSGGIDAASYQDIADDAMDALNEELLASSTNGVASVMSRLLSGASNVIKGDSMIFPKIYQSSSYNKSYTITIDLRSPYGTKKAYFINVLVPLFHALALAIPKQTTANSYGAPFLVKCYYQGGFSCNLGMVSSISIEKNPSGDTWTVDNYPSEIKVTLTVEDLYSDLNMSPAGDTLLFLANSSLIEYIATCCGVNLTVPQLKNKVANIATAIVAGLDSFKEDVTIGLFDGAENIIASFTGV